MKQVTQTLRTGIVQVNEVPVPTLTDSFVLVKNTVSVISAGTEKTKIDMGKKNLLQKAKARPDLVKQVLQKIQTEGLKKTLQTVKSRLESPSPLGYSCAGEVVAAGGLVEGIQPGDRVACGGADYANHAEFVTIPKNLVVKIPDSVTDEEAAFTTVGSIAMQGVRLAEPKLGETFLVLGLGLLGQIAVQLLRANGCNVIATDLDASLVKQAEDFGAVGAGPGSNVESLCKELTAGHGVDGVLVCAGTSSNQPIELCGAVTREKGRVVVVGAVRMDIPREDYFKKEISVVISRSYGPGRYDPFYEENGNDYPLGYVRFTEQRNMQTFLELVGQGKVDVKSLITHRFMVDQAADAYQLIEGAKTEPYLGIVMQYAAGTDVLNKASRITTSTKAISKNKLGISFFGAGNYATASLLPPLADKNNVEFIGLVTASGRTAQGVAKQFSFAFCAAEFNEILTQDTDAIMVTTRHDTHASSVVAAINANKHVYVEKPIALTVEELMQIQHAKLATNIESNTSQVMVGFNRRFAPSTQDVIAHFSGVKTPLVVNIRVNSGNIPADHWIQDVKTGGGRVIGEGCHFVDLASALVGSNPKTVTAIGTAKANKSAVLNDNVVISLTFENGSVATIVYTADGSKAMQKEHVEVFGGGRSAVINDFKEAVLYSGDSKQEIKKQMAQDKGQKAMLNAWLAGLISGVPCVSYDCLMSNSLATILAVESLALGTTLNVDLSILEQQ
ncbi:MULTISPECIES: bi-domain-containing oxidoreductase [Pseudoalteromonas]|jgi:predicted dehydrogenase/threonine dehydrogenase-like Zn-dependent dehydrogenase|uniref:bi-domain-containing oxidoreductase n=1 Tax=Pseudoalteromonas TaxID=53246 RepID=UPI000C5B71BB|nr:MULTISPECIES: bi-domain-containing oxidoreductase [Pseudoalteromonas]MAY60019.1 oxidoreductase [Pseudoalteromonas sp.]MDN3404860.1 bi-domain-containing oxidoreductase [Pseudoalteromonas sp. APC 3218]MDN3407791.1 bi-domain-containing oxidoreductase [Pseudoalteromonas sp. APC 3894]MDN3415431.1 bi-domain-containing oxidoreductase [Pseudoalteromonas sp. APC 3227]MDN3419109.1 bi-domain-containing oxidoreductase [Pseudoalteromonas sp. APC 3895]|tara:strand:+ start:20608 stop:22797 length:2190 start_codon:yes stop_codon:yes gene_type:complete